MEITSDILRDWDMKLPLFSKDWDKIKEHRLNQANVLIVEKEDGYYLKWKI